ncbi:topology modulation protein [Sphingomonas sp.]|uniref:topology modulation protein n=1 Tax=Sphingomonas sp. TaxID=28214 RepID=UPI0025EA21D1|nr:topology modulation protein [Sphingomonas sp.]
MQRIMIIGQPGSGKSRLARTLGRITDLPVIHIDTIHWRPGWIERAAAEKTRLCLDVEMGDRWIFEGGHSATWENRISRADMLIWLDRGTLIRICRVIWRAALHIGRTRPDLPQGCPERWSMLPDFLRYIWRSRLSARERMANLVGRAPASCRVVVLRSNRQVARFVAEIIRGDGPTGPG